MVASVQNIDWRKPNVLLAEELGVSPERVRQLRLEFRAPAPLFKNVPARLAGSYLGVIESADLIRGLPFHVAERILGFRLNGLALRKFAQRHAGLPHAETKHPWELMNFELPTSVLADIWKIDPTVFSVRRARRKHPSPRWSARHKKKLLHDKVFRAAVTAERQKATRFFAPLERH